jgi:hypothetical protein
VKDAVTVVSPVALAHTAGAVPVGAGGVGSSVTKVDPWLLQPLLIAWMRVNVPLAPAEALHVTLRVTGERLIRGDVTGRLLRWLGGIVTGDREQKQRGHRCLTQN